MHIRHASSSSKDKNAVRGASVTRKAMDRSDVIVAVEKSEAGREPFLSQLKQLNRLCHTVQSFHHEYDFKPEVPGNGFRSIVKSSDIYFQKLKHELEHNNLHSDILKDYETIANTLNKSLAIAMMIRRKGVDYDCISITDDDGEIFTKMFAVTAEDVEPLYGRFMCFNCKTSVQSTYGAILYLWHFLSSSLYQRLRMLTSSAFTVRHRANLSSNMTMKTMKNLDAGFPVSTINRLMNAVLTDGVAINRTTVQCSNKFEIILPDTTSPAIIAESAGRQSTIKSCFIVPHPPDAKKEIPFKSVILHCPGGGFVVGHPELYMLILSHYADQFSVPVVTLNYNKAPDHPYPSPLQELLDLYLFLTSGHDRVVDLIGFHPERIILSGDSAGANLALSTIIALNRIRKQFECEIRMPHSLITWYPYFSPTFVALPSYTLLSACSTTQAGTLATINPAYAGVQVLRRMWGVHPPDS